MKHALILAVAGLLAACTTSPTTPTVDADVIRSASPVAIGEALRLGDIYLTPMAVTEDSRCPASVECVWAGTVKVETRIDGAGWRETVELQLSEPQNVRGHRIVLDAVAPARLTPGPIAHDAYRFSFSN